MNNFIIFVLILSVYSRYLSIDYVKYLETYGYLNITTNRRAHDIKSALLSFQKNYNLKQSGVLDYETLELMRTPRCGLKDFNDNFRFQTNLGWNYVGNFRQFPYYIKNRLVYMDLESLTDVINQSFSRWSQYTELVFRRTGIPNKSVNTINIRFAPSNDFKGRYDIAEAFFPVYGGEIKFRQLPHWAFPNKDGVVSTQKISLLETAIHEIGHSLGLEHSTYQNSIMYPYLNKIHNKHDLHVDDIRGIQTLYLPTRCKSSEIDTIFATNSNTIFIFKNANYWELKMNPDFNNRIFDHKSKNIAHKWRELPANIDAAFYCEEFTYFFKNTLTWKYSGTQLVTGYPKNISAEFVGVPNQIDAAMIGNDKNMYFFKGMQFWKIEPKEEFNVTYDSPRNIAEFGLSVSIDASIYLQNLTYFFKNNVFFKMGAENYPKSTGYYWFNCFVLTGNTVSVKYNNNYY